MKNEGMRGVHDTSRDLNVSEHIMRGTYYCTDLETGPEVRGEPSQRIASKGARGRGNPGNEGKLKCLCGASRKGTKLGSGWKQKGSQVFCPDCWRKLYHIRAVTFPIASIVEGPGENIKERWKAFREAIGICWQDATQLANWAITELAKRDVVRTPEMEKLAPMPPNKKGSPSSYLYKSFEPGKPLAVECFPRLDSAAIVAILNTVQAKYKAERFDAVWRRERSLPTFRYPMPYPLGSQDWKPSWLSETEKAPCITISLAKQKFKIRLRSGRGHKRQTRSFSALLAGDAVACEMAIYRKRAAQNDNRIGLKTKTDGATVRYDYMVKLVMWLPKEIVKREEKILTVTTDPASFIVASFGESELWRVNADHVKKWIREYDSRRHRLADDLKAELRSGGKDRFADLRLKLAKHQSDRIKSFTHEQARLITNYAARHKCTEVMLNDSCREYLPDFPWANFKTQLQAKLHEHNIELSEWESGPEQVEAGGEDNPVGQEAGPSAEERTEGGEQA